MHKPNEAFIEFLEAKWTKKYLSFPDSADFKMKFHYWYVRMYSVPTRGQPFGFFKYIFSEEGATDYQEFIESRFGKNYDFFNDRKQIFNYTQEVFIQEMFKCLQVFDEINFATSNKERLKKIFDDFFFSYVNTIDLDLLDYKIDDNLWLFFDELYCEIFEILYHIVNNRLKMYNKVLDKLNLENYYSTYDPDDEKLGFKFEKDSENKAIAFADVLIKKKIISNNVKSISHSILAFRGGNARRIKVPIIYSKENIFPFLFSVIEAMILNNDLIPPTALKNKSERAKIISDRICTIFCNKDGTKIIPPKNLLVSISQYYESTENIGLTKALIKRGIVNKNILSKFRKNPLA